MKVTVQRTDEETGRLAKRTIQPTTMVEQWFADCAGFNISQHSDKMRLIDVKSNWKTTVYLHDKNQNKIHMQLSKFIVNEGRFRFFEILRHCNANICGGHKKYDVTVSKTINLNTEERPCYEGSDYNDQEYLKVVELMRSKFNCTTPFVPKHLRLGLPVCPDNESGRQAHDFVRTRTGDKQPNMWNSDYYFVPPCTYYEFNLYELSHRESSK